MDGRQRSGFFVRRDEPRRFDVMTPPNVVLWLAALACCFFFVGCKQEDASTRGSERDLAPATSSAHQPASQVASSTGHPEQAHDPAHPPIDCPLRKQGIDPSHLRPFEDVEKYIAFLERSDRAGWQKPDQVVSALGLTGGETIVDLGAGSGYFAFRFAKALPRGRVIAADIEPEMIRHIHHKAMTDGVTNIEARLIQADAPSVPAGVDLVFVCDVLHHVSDRPAWLSKITKAMPSDARLVLIEFKEGDLPEGPPESMKIPRSELVKLVTDAGLVLAAEHAKLLPYQTFLVFRKP
jgi:SAM-dependent methyltransferase